MMIENFLEVMDILSGFGYNISKDNAKILKKINGHKSRISSADFFVRLLNKKNKFLIVGFDVFYDKFIEKEFKGLDFNVGFFKDDNDIKNTSVVVDVKSFFDKGNFKHLDDVLFVIGNFSDSDFKGITIIKNKEDLRKYIFNSKSFFDNSSSYHGGDIYEIMCWLFDEKVIKRKEKFPSNFRKIVKVWANEDGSERIALLRQSLDEDGEKYEDYKVILLTNKDKQFNFLDEGKYIYNDEMYLFDLEPKDCNIDVLIELDCNILYKSEYDKKCREMRVGLERDKRKEDLNCELAKRITKQIDNVGKNPIVFNEFVLHENRVEFRDYVLKSSSMTDLREMYRQNFTEDFKGLDFNEFALDFVKQSLIDIEFVSCWNLENVGQKKTLYTTIGKVKCKVVMETRETGRHLTINGIRINITELNEILKRCLCFQTQNDFDNYLGKISKCSLAIRDLIDNGKVFEVGLESYSDGEHLMTMRLNFKRHKGKTYVTMADGKLLSVSKSNTIMSMRDRYSISEAVNKLKNSINFKNSKDLKLLFTEAVENYKKAIRKSKQLLDKTLKIVGGKVAEFKDEKGWLIEGKLNKYFISKSGKIYSYPRGNYICVVDSNYSDSIGYDKIVDRIYALANDKLLGNEISTLGVV